MEYNEGKMNLTILIYSLASGGAERVVSILLKELSTSYNITLVLMNDTIFYEIPESVKIVFLGNSNPYENGLIKLLKLPIYALKYKKVLKDSDISLSFMNRPNYINVFSKLFGNKSKIIISERIAPSKEYPSNNFKDRISKILIKFLYPKANLVVPNAKGIENDLIKYFKLKENIKVVHNPIDILRVLDNQRQDTNFQFDNFSFITIGRFQEQKNHKLLINAIKDIDSNLYIIGDGELRNKLEKQIFDLGLQNKVFLLGRQTNPYKYLAKADCFVFGSNYEGFPNVLLEALACSLPVISTDCKSGPREILSPSSDIETQLKKDIEKVEYGLLTTVNDVASMTKAMNLIIEDKNLRDNYKCKALTRAKDFDKDKIIKEWINLLD